MPENLAVIQPSPSAPVAPEPVLRKVALRFLPEQTLATETFEQVFGVPDLPLARRFLRERLALRGIRTDVLDAMDVVPRHVFAPSRAAVAYVDLALEVDKTFLQAPSTVAQVVSTLTHANSSVLEIGTGTGYQAAVLAAFGAQVTTIDSDIDRQQKALHLFSALGLDIQSRVRRVDPLDDVKRASFDIVIVNEALHRMPRRLACLLYEKGGSIVTPIVLADGTQRLMRYTCGRDSLVVDLGPCLAPQGRTRR